MEKSTRQVYQGTEEEETMSKQYKCERCGMYFRSRHPAREILCPECHKAMRREKRGRAGDQYEADVSGGAGGRG